jgi:hypothetical protein
MVHIFRRRTHVKFVDSEGVPRKSKWSARRVTTTGGVLDLGLSTCRVGVAGILDLDLKRGDSLSSFTADDSQTSCIGLDTTRHDGADEGEEPDDSDENFHGSTPDLYSTPYFKEAAPRESSPKNAEQRLKSTKASIRGLDDFLSSEKPSYLLRKRAMSSARSCASMPHIANSSKLAPVKSIDDILLAYEKIVNDKVVESGWLFEPTGW